MTEPKERLRIVCITASETPAVDSVLVQCVECGRDVWRSRGSLSQDLDPMCMPCLPTDAKPAASTVQIKEVAEELGITPLELANFFASKGIEIVGSDEL